MYKSALKISLEQHLEKIVKRGRSVPIQIMKKGKLIWVQSDNPGDRKDAIDRIQLNLSHMA